MNSREEKLKKRRKSSSQRKKGLGFTGISIIIILIIAAGFLIAPYISQFLLDKKTQTEQEHVQLNLQEKEEQSGTAPQQPLTDQPATQEPTIESLGKEEQDITEKKTVGELKQEVAEASCEKIADSIVSFYSHLDQQPYLQKTKIESKSGAYFTSLIQKLLNNPPIVTRETDDLFTILQNTAHFFRIIGKKNIFIIKGILHNEKPMFENILAHYYNLVQQPDCSMKGLALKIPENSLYEYAGFFLNTMGGRLYLFRRDSHSRMVIIYYSLLIIDQANQNGTNRHGIHIAQPIDSLITEIESVGDHLKLRETYLDRLYDLKEQYQ